MLKMEKPNISSWLTNKLKIFLLLLNNATLCFFVLYFSIHDNEAAAFLSYVSVTSIILTIKYYLWELIANSESVAYFIDCSSKILILAGISLLMFPQFWNTAFYSICLGIVIQLAKHEIFVRVRNWFLYLYMQVSGKDAKTKTTDLMKLVKELQNEACELPISENKTKFLNGDVSCASIRLSVKNDLLLGNTTEKQNIERKHREENIQKGIQTGHKILNNCHPDVSETHKEIAMSCTKENNRGDLKESDKNENLVKDNYQGQIVSMEAVESTLKRMEYFTMSNAVSNYEDNEVMKNFEKFCTLQIKLLNLQELKLSECSKLESKFELTENNIERELKRNEEGSVDIPMKHSASSNENQKDFSINGTKQLDTTDNSIKTVINPGNNVKHEFYSGKVNTRSDVNADPSENVNQNEFISSCSGNDSFRTNKSKIDGEPVPKRLFVKDYENLVFFNSDSTMVDTTLQHKENTGRVNSQKVDTDSQQINSSENQSSNSKPKYESMHCTSLETISIQSEEEKSAYQMKLIPAEFNDESTNLNARLQQKQRYNDDCSADFKTNREKKLSETHLKANSFEADKNLNSEVKYSNMNGTSMKTTDIQSQNYISEKKFFFQQINDGNLETGLGGNDEVLLESDYFFKPKCLSTSFKILHNSNLNESADVEERNDTNESMKKVSEDEGTTRFPNVSDVDDVVNRIDLSFIYALGFNVR